MRLKDWESKHIIEAVEDVFQKKHLSLNQVELYLYGSRTDDQKKGGDIDLLLRVPQSQLSQVKELKFQINMSIQDRIGEQKVDILIIDINSPTDPFSRIALKQALLIKKWLTI